MTTTTTAPEMIHVTDADLEETFGPQWQAIVEIVRKSAAMTEDEAKRLDATWHAARDAAWDAVCAARDQACDAAWHAAWDATRDDEWDAARDAANAAARDAAWEAAWHDLRVAAGVPAGDANRAAAGVTAWHAARVAAGIVPAGDVPWSAAWNATYVAAGDAAYAAAGAIVTWDLATESGPYTIAQRDLLIAPWVSVFGMPEGLADDATSGASVTPQLKETTT